MTWLTVAVADRDCGPLAGELGRRGCAFLSRYEIGGDLAALDAGLTQLERAVVLAPEHPDRWQWWLALGSGYEWRAGGRGADEDYARAIRWYGRLREGAPPGDGSRAVTAIALAGAHWSRYWLIRYGTDAPPEVRAARAHALVGELAALAVGDG